MGIRKTSQQPAKIAVLTQLKTIEGGHEVSMLTWISHHAIVGDLVERGMNDVVTV